MKTYCVFTSEGGTIMSRLNRVQTAIKELNGGQFQKMCDDYLWEKYHLNDIHSIGEQPGTNKTRTGVPDTFWIEKDGSYVVAMYGSVQQKKAFQKLKDDICSIFEGRDEFDVNKVSKIICCNTITKVTPRQIDELRMYARGKELEIRDLETLAQDISKFFPWIAYEYLGISNSTDQVWNVAEFVKIHDRSQTNASLENELVEDEKLKRIQDELNQKDVVVLCGDPGTGKTRLAIEVFKKISKYENNNVWCVKNNSQPLYDDLKNNLEPDRPNYILLDDVNGAKNLVSILSLLETERYQIHFLMTVRKYFYKEIESLIFPLKSCVITFSSDDQVTDKILKNSLGEENHHVIEMLGNKVKGNQRLAVLAANLIKHGDVDVREKLPTILTVYYQQIIQKQGLNRIQKNALFFVAALGNISINDSGLTNVVEKNLELKVPNLKDTLDSLVDKELCDRFKNEIYEISDQSLKDYIIFNYLIEKERTSINGLYSIFDEQGNKSISLIKVVQSCLTVDNSASVFEKVQYQLLDILDDLEGEKKKQFFLQFSPIIADRAIKYCYSQYKNLSEPDPANLSLDSFEKLRRTDTQFNDVIDILGRLSNTKQMKNAFNLILEFTNYDYRCLPQIEEILKNNFSIDTITRYPFRRMQLLLNEIEISRHASDIKSWAIFGLLFYWLGFQFHVSSSTYDTHVLFTTLRIDNKLDNNQSYLKLRRQIIKKIGVLYEMTSDNNLKLAIENKLYYYNFYRYSTCPNIVQSDVEKIIDVFFSGNGLSKTQFNVFSKFYHFLVHINNSSNIAYQPGCQQMLIDRLEGRKLTTYLIDNVEFEKENKKDVYKFLDNCDQPDFTNILQECADIYKSDGLHVNLVNRVISRFLMQRLQQPGTQEIFRAVLQSGYENVPLYQRIIFLGNHDYDWNNDFIERNCTKDEFTNWKAVNIISCAENVNKESKEDIYKYISGMSKNLLSECSLETLGPFIMNDSNLLKFLFLNNINYINLFPYPVSENSTRKIINFFNNNLEVLENLYFSYLSQNSIDPTAELFKKLDLADKDFLNHFFSYLSDVTDFSKNFNRAAIKEYLWSNSRGINHILDFVQKNLFSLYGSGEFLFYNLSEAAKKSLRDRISQTDDFKLIKNIMNKIVTEFLSAEDRLLFWKEISLKKLPLVTFKELNVLPNYQSWSDSRIPLIDDQIEFSSKLADIFGEKIENIELKVYLNDSIKQLMKKREKVLIEEKKDKVL